MIQKPGLERILRLSRSGHRFQPPGFLPVRNCLPVLPPQIRMRKAVPHHCVRQTNARRQREDQPCLGVHRLLRQLRRQGELAHPHQDRWQAAPRHSQPGLLKHQRPQYPPPDLPPLRFRNARLRSLEVPPPPHPIRLQTLLSGRCLIRLWRSSQPARPCLERFHQPRFHALAGTQHDRQSYWNW